MTHTLPSPPRVLSSAASGRCVPRRLPCRAQPASTAHMVQYVRPRCCCGGFWAACESESSQRKLPQAWGSSSCEDFAEPSVDRTCSSSGCCRPSDFDFRLRASASDGGIGATSPPAPNPTALAQRLRAEGAVVFPALHGRFGEDGGLQARCPWRSTRSANRPGWPTTSKQKRGTSPPPRSPQAVLEAASVPFVGTGAAAAEAAFDKAASSARLASAGFPTLPQASRHTRR